MRWSFLIVLLAVAAAPASRPNDEVADLRRIIAGLQQQVADLKAENAALHSQLVSSGLNPSTRPAASEKSRIATARSVSKGMSAATVQRSMGEPDYGRLGDHVVYGEGSGTIQWIIRDKDANPVYRLKVLFVHERVVTSDLIKIDPSDTNVRPEDTRADIDARFGPPVAVTKEAGSAREYTTWEVHDPDGNLTLRVRAEMAHGIVLHAESTNFNPKSK